jgi:hypothetical protein
MCCAGQMSDDVDDLDDSFEPWTEAGADRLVQAASAVQIAVATHAAAVIAAGGDIDGVFQASEALLPALLEYADAQFDFTGTGFPLGVLEQFVGEDDEDEDAEADGQWPTTGISVVQRRDYVVSDTDSVLAAGRAAYLRVWPDHTEADSDADVSHLGRALYQLAHAEGWDSLAAVEGLEPVAGIVAVVKQDEFLGPDPDEWADEVLDEEAQVLYSQADVFRS